MSQPVRNIVILTGAGVSAESGIDTFRSEGGLWEQHRVEDVATPEAFARDPDLVLRFYDMRREAIQTKQPNKAHDALARLDSAWQGGLLIVTQNVDDLHERAGSRQVHHLHGSLSQFWCDSCGSHYHQPLPDMPEPQLEMMPPSCECGGLIRPGIVWFGEPLPDAAWQAAVEAVAHADVVVVVGTSGIVYPAAGLPEYALARGTVVVEVNPAPTPLSAAATVTIRDTATAALPGLLHRLPTLLGD